jgi:hypothetical protein
MTLAQQRAGKEWINGFKVVRNHWWMDECKVHGVTSFNSIIEGCESCARERLARDSEVSIVGKKK